MCKLLWLHQDTIDKELIRYKGLWYTDVVDDAYTSKLIQVPSALRECRIISLGRKYQVPTIMEILLPLNTAETPQNPSQNTCLSLLGE
jgi:hypothetical protein